jgi:phospholipid-binding lipoprotein MlaA
MLPHSKGPGLALRATIIFLALMLTACAARNATEQAESPDPTEQPENPDPIERVNRGIYQFNVFADTWVLRPIARGYEWLFPPIFRTGFNNFFENLGTPVDALNALLQGKFLQGFADVGRFAMNTTFGLAGFLDPATSAGLVKHDEDFGQTLGVWGVPEGPYLMIPFFGPRTFRSGFGSTVDLFTSPLFSINDSSIRWGLFIADNIHARSTLLGFDQELKRAFDPYAFIRDSYLQNRQYLLYDGDPPEEDFFLDDEEFDDF